MPTVYIPPSGGIAIPSGSTKAQVLPSGGIYTETAGGDVTAPTITGPSGATGGTSAISIAENTTAVFTFTADEAVTWDLNGGADVALFSINSGTGALAFLVAPDFDIPADTDLNNTYVVGVRATDAATNATTQTCTVTVTDVAIPTAPTIGANSGITASGATINWTDNSSNETTFQVQVETPSGAGNWTDASSSPAAANATSLAIGSLSSSTEYRPRVRATGAEGSSAYSTGSAFTTDAGGGVTVTQLEHATGRGAFRGQLTGA
jgi:hypothetical protein